MEQGKPGLAARQPPRVGLAASIGGAGCLFSLPGFPAVRTGPDFVAIGRKYNLRRTTYRFVNINIRYVGTKYPTFAGRLHLQPSYTIVARVIERSRTSSGPYIRDVTGVASQWMIGAQGILPAFATVERTLEDARRDDPCDAWSQGRQIRDRHPIPARCRGGDGASRCAGFLRRNPLVLQCRLRFFNRGRVVLRHGAIEAGRSCFDCASHSNNLGFSRALRR